MLKEDSLLFIWNAVYYRQWITSEYFSLISLRAVYYTLSHGIYSLKTCTTRKLLSNESFDLLKVVSPRSSDLLAMYIHIQLRVPTRFFGGGGWWEGQKMLILPVYIVLVCLVIFNISLIKFFYWNTDMVIHGGQHSYISFVSELFRYCKAH